MAKIRSLAQTPPMGWNSFDCYGRMANEQVMFENLKVFAERLKPAGYDTFVLDIAWYAVFDIPEGRMFPIQKESTDVTLDEYCRYLPAGNFFPNGLAELIEATHNHGLKFGIHMMRGIPRKAVELNLPIKGTTYRAADVVDKNSECRWCKYNWGVDMSKPGGQEYYDSVIELLAEWGVDFIKYDDIVNYPDEIHAVANAIENVDRDVMLSLSLGTMQDTKDINAYRRANMLRITHDIWDDVEDFDSAFERWEMFQGLQEPGFWPDLDMIPFGHLVLCNKPDVDRAVAGLGGKGTERMCQYNRYAKETFITMRALAASPLFMGGNLPTTDEESFEIITNPDMLACDQNGVMGRCIYRRDGVDIWKTPQKHDHTKGWLGIFNRTDTGKRLTLSLEEMQLEGAASAKDIWKDIEIPLESQNTFLIPAYGVIFLAL